MRSCFCHPCDDPYMGSYRDKTFKPTEKIVLFEFLTRAEAEKAESNLHEFFQVVPNPRFANKCKNILNGFSRAGSTNTAEHREKTRVANQGKCNPNYGKPRSLSTKAKQSKALKGRVFNAEVRLKMRKAKETSMVAICLRHLETSKIFQFSSINEAARELNLNPRNLSNLLYGRQRSTKGYVLSTLAECPNVL